MMGIDAINPNESSLCHPGYALCADNATGLLLCVSVSLSDRLLARTLEAGRA